MKNITGLIFSTLLLASVAFFVFGDADVYLDGVKQGGVSSSITNTLASTNWVIANTTWDDVMGRGNTSSVPLVLSGAMPNSVLITDTADGSDNKAVYVGGGGDATSARGGAVYLLGNENVADPGDVIIIPGDDHEVVFNWSTGSEIIFDSSGLMNFVPGGASPFGAITNAAFIAGTNDNLNILGNVAVTGTNTAGYFEGDGSALTGIGGGAFTVVETLTSAAIQTAIDALAAAGTGGRVQLVEGTYVMAAEGINVSDNIEIVGCGWGTILDSTGQAQSDAVINVTGVGNVFKDFKILCAKTGGTFDTFDFTAAADSNMVDHVTVMTSDNNAFQFASGSSYNTVKYCTIVDNDNRSVDDDGSLNEFLFNTSVGSDLTAFIVKAGTKVDGNKIFDCNDKSIYLNGVGASASFNYIQGSVQAAVYLAAAGCKANNNTVIDPSTTGIEVVGDHATVVGNFVHEAGNNNAAYKFNGADDGTFTGNNAEGVTAKAEWMAHFDDCERWSVIGNTAGGVYDTADIQIDSDCDGNLVQGNTLAGSVAKIINNQPTQGESYDTGRNVLGKTIEVTTFTAAAVQTALNAVGDNGKVICIPGTYVFTDTGVTNAYTNVTISAYGAIWDASAGQAAVPLTINKDHITVEGLTILGDDAAGAVDLVYVNASAHGTLKDVSLVNANDDALETTGDSDYWTLFNVTVDNAADMGLVVASGADNWKIASCVVMNCSDDAITVAGSRAVIGNCYVYNNGDFGILAAGNRCEVNGNIVHSNTGIGIQGQNVCGNVVYQSGSDGILSSMAPAKIVGNNVRESGNGKGDITIKNITSGGGVVSGNITTSSAGKSEYGIYGDNVDGIAIVGNTCLGHDTAGIFLDADSSLNLVSANNLEAEAVLKISNLQAVSPTSPKVGVDKLSADSGTQINATADGMNDDSYNGITIGGLNAGENITQWDAVFFNSADSEFHQADASTGSGEFPARGIAVAAGTDGNELIVLTKGVVRNDGWAWGTVGGTIYLGESDGALTQTAPSDSGDAVQIMGWAISDDEMMVDVSTTWLVAP